MKLIGALFIAAASAAMGLYLSAGMYRRYISLERLIAALRNLKTSICVMGTELSSALRDADKTMKPSGVFSGIADGLKDKGTRGAWESAFAEYKGRLGLTARDLEIISSIGKWLGATDAREQGESLENTAALLRVQADEARAECEKKGRLYRSCGILFGALVILVLL